MSPIIQSLANASAYGYRSLSAAVTADTGAYFPLQVVTVGSAGASTVTFSNIPQTGYAHLQIRCITRSNSGSAGGSGIQVTANNDSTSGNYSFHRLAGDGSSASAYGQSGLDYIMLNSNAGNASGIFAVSIIDILDYTSTNKGKTFRSFTGLELNNTLGVVTLRTQGWFATPAAITSLTFTPSTGSLDVYSQFALYGIKGA